MEGRMHTLVVGVDGSGPSIRALRFAADLADELQDPELVVVFARHIYVAMPERAAEDMFADVLDRAEQAIRTRAEDILGHRHARWKLIARTGEPAHVLRQVAAETHASFIVVGRRGWSTVSELVLGSVSNRLVHQSGVPVLLVPDEPGAPEPA
jgi:nucleotide-binding universal stress UspA family protein